MGSPKGLLDYKGKLWILEQISRYKHELHAKVYIGLGYDYESYLSTIPWFTEALDDFYLYNEVEVRIVINNNPKFGAFSTLQTVLDSIDINTNILVQPIDVPLANKQSLFTIINENNTIVIPKYAAKNGHPVKLKPEFWNNLLSIDKSSKKARLDFQIKAIDISSVTYIKVTDSSVYQNINTMKEWNNYLKNNLI